MAIDYRTELRRPLTFSLAVVGAVLLLWLLVVSIVHARERGAHERLVETLLGGQIALQTDLDRQRAAAGSLAELQAKAAATERQGREANEVADQAKARLASLGEERQAAEARTGEVRKGADAETQRLANLQAQVQQAEGKLAPMRDATTAAEQTATARTKDLADVGRRLEEARQGEATLRGDLSALSQEATSKTADLAKAEQSQQKAREGSAAAQKELSDARAEAERIGKQRSDLTQVVTDLTANRDKVTAEVALAGRQLQQGRDAVAATQRDLADAQVERDRVISERGQAEQAVRKLTVDREGGMSDLEGLRKRQADAQAQLATLTEGMAARNREMAELDDRLGATRQELGTTQAKLAEVRQQLSGPPATKTE